MRKNRTLLIIFALSFAITVAAAVYFFIALKEVNTPIVIHFDAFRGIDVIGSRNDALNLFVLALILVGLNIWLASKLYYRERMASYVLAFASLFVALAVFVAARVIITIN